MAKREKNWQPDIYDLETVEQTVSAVDLDSYDEGDEIEDDLYIEAEPVAVKPLVKTTKKGTQQPVTVTVRARESRDSSDLVVLGGMIAGAVIGALFGLLKAPDRGEETRNKLTASARQQLEEGKSRVEELAGSAVTKVSSVTTGGNSADAVSATNETTFTEGDRVRVVPASEVEKIETSSASATVSTAGG